MKLTVKALNGERNFRVSVMGLELDFDGMKSGQEISLCVDDSGNVSVDEPVKEIPSGETETEPEKKPEENPVTIGNEDTQPDHEILFKKLVILRKQLSAEQSVPPYCIFTDKSLKEMAFTLPRDLESFGHIGGVGETKLHNYGERFLTIIREHMEEMSA